MPTPPDDARVYTLADLGAWEKIRPGLPPSLAVLGHPVAHSVSPQMHNAALAELAKKHPQLKDWRYFKFDIESADFQSAANLLSNKNFVGVNLTVPHKVIGLTVAIGKENTLRIGATNTLVHNPESKWDGYNTDGFGLVRALKNDLDFELNGSQVILLGAGGAARATAVQCLDSGCAKIWIGSRDELRRRKLIEDLNDQRVSGFFLDAPANISQFEAPNLLVINATPVGLNDSEQPNYINFLSSGRKLFDMTYIGGDKTKFVKKAIDVGLRATDGLNMLIWQGAKSLTIWLKAQEGIDIQPESIAQTMMNAACDTLGQPHRHA